MEPRLWISAQSMLYYQLSDHFRPHPQVPCPLRSAPTSRTVSWTTTSQSLTPMSSWRKTLLMSRWTKARWSRAYELLKYPEMGNRLQTLHLHHGHVVLLLPSEMRDHLIAKDGGMTLTCYRYTEAGSAALLPPSTQIRQPLTPCPAPNTSLFFWDQLSKKFWVTVEVRSFDHNY